jgi:hypothetical protein
MSLPSSVGLPQEMMLGHLDYSIPPDAKSFSVKVQPSNISTIQATYQPAVTASTAFPDVPFVAQNIIFDIPCGQSPSMFLDNRFTTLNFQLNVSCTNINGGSTGTFTDSYLRSGGYSWFDRMYITSQNGQIIEDISEFALVNDTLVALQMNNAVRHGVANQYGFDVNYQQVASQGHKIDCMSSSVGAGNFATTLSETHSYSIPLTSGILGVLADKFLNIGRTSKLQIVLQTAPLLPISGGVNAAFTTAAPTFQFQLSNFSIQAEYVDIGINALQMLDQTLVDGKAYIHGTTYRTSSATMPSSAGSSSVLAGIRASSVKSLFARFAQGGTASSTNSLNGKFDSFNPMISSINFNIGGIKFPQTPVSPLLQPSQAFRETQMAIGSFNNAQFQSCIVPSAYCKLSAGGTASGTGTTNTRGATQEFNWSLGSIVNAQAQFIFGENVEVCARRGLLSGLNCTSAPIFVEMITATAATNSHTLYVMAMLDHVIIHDCKSGDIQVRI